MLFEPSDGTQLILFEKILFEKFYKFCSKGLIFLCGVRCDQSLDDYRSAPRLFHRKIRQLDRAEEGNVSFVLDIPYPQHFFYSLNRLNLSLPFLTNVTVPEDPPTPDFDIDDVINRPEYRNPPTTERIESPVDQKLRLVKRNVATNRVRLSTYQPVVIRRKLNSTDSDRINSTSSTRSIAYKERLTKQRLAQLRNATAKIQKFSVPTLKVEDSGRNNISDTVQGDNSQQVRQINNIRPTNFDIEHFTTK